MNRDTVKTLAGLVIIAVIVVATFLYGNAQRQNQLKHDANVSKQQAAASPSASASAASAAPASGQTAANTAPVQSPASSNIQGGAAASSTPKPSSTPAKTPTPTPAPTQVATVPQTGGTAQPLPQTGPAAELAGVIGLAAIATMWLWLKRSQRAIFTAARNNR